MCYSSNGHIQKQHLSLPLESTCIRNDLLQFCGATMAPIKLMQPAFTCTKLDALKIDDILSFKFDFICMFFFFVSVLLSTLSRILCWN